MSEKKAPGKLAHAKGTQKSAKRTTATSKKSKGFTDEEWLFQRDRADRVIETTRICEVCSRSR